ncbi:hypothetical protein GCM10023205_84890 [Yinghuangia aomiensis]|uniref:Uncharacterized protein n=1 Tax=Yinghuangia aomiensis TaxID=676205 RepID=A0ABP9IHQ0_9ACTN
MAADDMGLGKFVEGAYQNVLTGIVTGFSTMNHLREVAAKNFNKGAGWAAATVSTRTVGHSLEVARGSELAKLKRL